MLQLGDVCKDHLLKSPVFRLLSPLMFLPAVNRRSQKDLGTCLGPQDQKWGEEDGTDTEGTWEIFFE